MAILQDGVVFRLPIWVLLAEHQRSNGVNFELLIGRGKMVGRVDEMDEMDGVDWSGLEYLETLHRQRSSGDGAEHHLYRVIQSIKTGPTSGPIQVS